MYHLWSYMIIFFSKYAQYIGLKVGQLLRIFFRHPIIHYYCLSTIACHYCRL